LHDDVIGELQTEIARGKDPNCSDDVARNVSSYVYQYVIIRQMKIMLNQLLNLMLKRAQLDDQTKTMDHMMLYNADKDRDFFTSIQITSKRQSKEYCKVYRFIHLLYSKSQMAMLDNFFLKILVSHLKDNYVILK